MDKLPANVKQEPDGLWKEGLVLDSTTNAVCVKQEWDEGQYLIDQSSVGGILPEKNCAGLTAEVPKADEFESEESGKSYKLEYQNSAEVKHGDIGETFTCSISKFEGDMHVKPDYSDECFEGGCETRNEQTQKQSESFVVIGSAGDDDDGVKCSFLSSDETDAEIDHINTSEGEDGWISTDMSEGNSTEECDGEQESGNKKRHCMEELRSGKSSIKSKKSGLKGSEDDQDTLLKNHSGQEERFPCYVCDKIFTSKTILNLHNTFHAGETSFKCKICGRPFKELRLLKPHMRVHAEVLPHLPVYECDFCDKKFNYKRRLMVHTRIHTGERPYKCLICHQAFREKGTLKEHSRIHTGEKPFKCSVCSMSFNRSTRLSAHAKMHDISEKESEYMYQCQLCDMKYKRLSSLSKHMKTHEPPHRTSKINHLAIERKNPDSTLKHHSHLSRDIPFPKPASKVSPYLPRIQNKKGCEASQMNPTTLPTRTPATRNHPEPGSYVLPYKCAICQKPFQRKSGVQRHMKEHANDFPYRCKVCGERFFTAAICAAHASIHIEERPFPCTVCDRAFKTQKTLDRHTPVHLKGKRVYRVYKCSVCPREYRCRKYFKRHLRSHDAPSRDEASNKIRPGQYILAEISTSDTCVLAMQAQDPNPKLIHVSPSSQNHPDSQEGHSLLSTLNKGQGATSKAIHDPPTFPNQTSPMPSPQNHDLDSDVHVGHTVQITLHRDHCVTSKAKQSPPLIPKQTPTSRNDSCTDDHDETIAQSPSVHVKPSSSPYVGILGGLQDFLSQVQVQLKPPLD